MKILHVITTISKGGAENQLLVLVKQQMADGDSVVVAPLKGALELLPSFEALGAKVDLRFHTASFFGQLVRARGQWLRTFDCIHCHLPRAELLLATTGLSYVVSRHYGREFFPFKGRIVSRYLGKVASRRAIFTVAISESVRNWILESGEMSSKSEVVVIPYGFESNVNRTCGEHAPEEESEKDCDVFAVFARLSPEKDLPTVIRAFSLLTKETMNGNKCCLLIYGDGPEKADLVRVCEEEGIDSGSVLKGRTENPLEVMRNVDVIIVSSQFEGFGMVYLEAMSVEKPLIVSKISAAVEVLGMDGAALYFEPGNFMELAVLMGNWRGHLPKDYALEQKKRLKLFEVENMKQKMKIMYESANQVARYKK